MPKKEKPRNMSNPKVVIIFNLPHKAPRGEEMDYIAEAEIEDQVKAVQDATEKLGFQCQLFPLKNEVEDLLNSLKACGPDAIINLCEAAFGDSHMEMHVPSLLELLGIPYTGSPPLTLGLCQDKGLAKAIMKANGVPTPAYQVLNSFGDWRGGIDYPLFVKPLREDASLGISGKSFVKDEVELKTQVEYVVGRYGQPALVEKYIDGRELNVAVLGNRKPKVLPISEILFEFADKPKIVDYAAKWIETSDEYKKTKPVYPAELSPSEKAKVEKVSLKAYEIMQCRDYARVDIRLKDSAPFVLEVNPNPDISPVAGFARSLEAAGIPYEEFIKKIIFSALKRTRKLTTH